MCTHNPVQLMSDFNISMRRCMMCTHNPVHVMADFDLSLHRRVHELQDKCGALAAELRRAAQAADEAHDRAMYTVRAQVVLKEVTFLMLSLVPYGACCGKLL